VHEVSRRVRYRRCVSAGSSLYSPPGALRPSLPVIAFRCPRVAFLSPLFLDLADRAGQRAFRASEGPIQSPTRTRSESTAGSLVPIFRLRGLCCDRRVVTDSGDWHHY
jgi:hypothetical protein